MHEYLADTKCRIALMHGEMSDLLTPDVQEYMEELTGRNAPTIEIPQSYHHVPLDQPLALIAALRANPGRLAAHHPQTEAARDGPLIEPACPD